MDGDCNLKYRNQMDIPSAEKVWAKEERGGKFGAEKWKDQRGQSRQCMSSLVTVQEEGLLSAGVSTGALLGQGFPSVRRRIP